MEEIKQTLENLTAQNQVLKEQLTNKNEQYIFQLERSLKASNVVNDKIQEKLAEMLPVLVEQQKKGMTARQIYGTVTECVESIIAGPAKNPDAKSPDWQIAVDGGLMVGGFFALIAGVTLLLNPERTEAMGFVTLLLNYLVGGLALLALSKVTPDINKPKGQRGYGRYLFVSTFVMFAWLVVVLGSQILVPASLNFVFPAVVYLFIGSGSLVAKWYLKKTLGITGGIL